MAYVYRHIRMDKNVPFYIGIGKTAYRHKTRQGRNPIWRRIAEKTEFLVEVLFENVSWEFACEKEIEFIKIYGRIDRGTGTLANLTDGGDGNLGLKHSDEALRKISEASRGRKSYWKGKEMSDEFKRKIGASKIGNTYTKGMKLFTQEQKLEIGRRAKGNKYCLGRVLGEETKIKIGNANRGRKHKEPWRCGLPGSRNGMFGKKHTEESKQKNRESQNRKVVLKKTLSGVILDEYSSISEAALRNNIFSSGVSAACRIYNGSNRYKGFVWEYKKAIQ